MSDESRKRQISGLWIGNTDPRTPEQIQKIKLGMAAAGCGIGVKKPQVRCHCGVVGGRGAMSKWHFRRCKVQKCHECDATESLTSIRGFKKMTAYIRNYCPEHLCYGEDWRDTSIKLRIILEIATETGETLPKELISMTFEQLMDLYTELMRPEPW